MVKIMYGGEVLDEECETVEEAYDRIDEIIKGNYEHHPTVYSEYSVLVG